MTEEMMQKLNASLDKVGQWVQDAEVFAREQAPLVVQEMLVWGWWQALLLIMVPIAVLLVIAPLTMLIWKWAAADKTASDHDFWGGAMAFSGMILLTCVFWLIGALIANVGTMVKISVAPRVYLLNELGILK